MKTAVVWTTSGLLDAVGKEITRANKKFESFSCANEDAFIRILGEEFGEVCMAVNQRKSNDELHKEIIQCIATCIRFLQGDLRDGNIP